MKINLTPLLLLLCGFVFIVPNNSIAFQKDSSLTLIIVPKASILVKKLDISYQVDLRIQNYEVRFPRTLYDYLRGFKDFTLSTRFDVLLQLEEEIDFENRKGLIEKSLKLVSEAPEAFLFPSFDKLTEKVLLRAEITDLRANPLAAARVRIRFSNFLNDDSLRYGIEELGNLLVKQIRENIDIGQTRKDIAREDSLKRWITDTDERKQSMVTSSNWLVGPKIPPFTSKKISILTALIGASSAVTYFIFADNQDDAAKNYLTKAEEATDSRDAVLNSINATKAKSRNELLNTVALVSLSTFVVLAFNDIFIQSKPQKSKASPDKKTTRKVGHNFQLKLNQDLHHQVVRLGISMKF